MSRGRKPSRVYLQDNLSALSDPPAYLPDEAKAVWQLVAREMGDNLRDIDRHTLERYAIAITIFRRTSELLAVGKWSQKKGELTLAKAITLWRSSAEEARRAEDQLCLSPLARARIRKSIGTTQSAANVLAQFLKTDGSTT